MIPIPPPPIPPVLPPPPPETAHVSAALTEARVDIRPDFTGAQIVLYGAVFTPDQRPPDVVVVVRGPERPVRLVRRVRVAGLWLNSRPVIFRGAPGFYMAAGSRPLQDMADFGTLRRHGVGLDHLKIDAPEEASTDTVFGVRDVVVSRLGADYLDWRRAVIRLKEREGLYDADPQGVRFVDKGLFRAEVRLPAQAPTGRYEARVLLFEDGRVVAERPLELVVEKVGLERALWEFAHHRPWLYGLTSVLVALLTGWASAALFRRN